MLARIAPKLARNIGVEKADVAASLADAGENAPHDARVYLFVKWLGLNQTVIRPIHIDRSLVAVGLSAGKDDFAASPSCAID